MRAELSFEEYTALDGVALAEQIAQGKISASAVRNAATSAIAHLNPTLNAVIIPAPAASEAMPGASTLAGVPFLLKDANLYSHDMPTSFGSAFFRDAAPKPDSILVARWRAAGLVFLGKTNTPEFTAEFVTEPRSYGPTLNPWNPGVTVGGSSGGAAAAVASGMVPIAHATDLGGSIRIPSACCGVFGLKTSVGLNPLGPAFEEIAGGLDSDHVITRTVRDSAASLDITSGPDISARATVARAVPSYLAFLNQPCPHLRIGVATAPPGGPMSGPNQVTAVQRIADLLANLGYHVEPYRFPDETIVGVWFNDLWVPDIQYLIEERAAELGRPPGPDDLEPLSWTLLEQARALSSAAFFAARQKMKAVTAAYLGSMAALDIILTPTLGEDPPPLGQIDYAAHHPDFDGWNDRGFAFAPYAPLSNLSGQPAASVPAGLTPDGLPVGIQLAGKPGTDHLVLRLAAEIEKALPWAQDLAALQRRLGGLIQRG